MHHLCLFYLLPFQMFRLWFPFNIIPSCYPKLLTHILFALRKRFFCKMCVSHSLIVLLWVLKTLFPLRNATFLVIVSSLRSQRSLCVRVRTTNIALRKHRRTHVKFVPAGKVKLWPHSTASYGPLFGPSHRPHKRATTSLVLLQMSDLCSTATR